MMGRLAANKSSELNPSVGISLSQGSGPYPTPVDVAFKKNRIALRSHAELPLGLAEASLWFI